ncbi:hypothetical protein KSS87_018408 [Heliosperma pusillum]|nr:hypothetical protein KSS87_018408 [Heliosperma pusillum]
MLSLRCCKNNIQTLYNFHHLLQYSTKSPNQSFANYLINSLGFSHQQALSTSTKFRSKNTNHFKSFVNANSVVDFLKQHDFDDTHIKKVVSSYPSILSANVDKTLKPKFKLLQDHGFSGFDLVSVISSSPSIITRHMNRIILELRVVLGSDENLTKLFKKSNSFTTISSLENLVLNVALLSNEYGIDIDVIRNGIVQHAGCFLRKPEFFRNVLVRVEEELGIPRNSRMFFYGIYVLTCLSKECLESKCEVFRSFGWTEYDVSELLRISPNALLISEENIRIKLGFLMAEMGYKPDYLISHSALFGYSLENRMVPRRRVLLILKEKGLLNYTFYSAVIKTETQFLKLFVEPYKEVVPDLLEVYLNSKDVMKSHSITLLHFYNINEGKRDAETTLAMAIMDDVGILPGPRVSLQNQLDLKFEVCPCACDVSEDRRANVVQLLGLYPPLPPPRTRPRTHSHSHSRPRNLVHKHHCSAITTHQHGFLLRRHGRRVSSYDGVVKVVGKQGHEENVLR